MKLSHDTTLELNDDVLSVKKSPYKKKYFAISLLDGILSKYFF